MAARATLRGRRWPQLHRCRWASFIGTVVLASGVGLAGCGSSKSNTPAPPKRIALVYRNVSGSIVVASVTGRTRRTLGPATQALLSPDGTRVLSLADAGTTTTLTLYRTGRAGDPRLLATIGAPHWSGAGVELLGWSPDSRYVVLSADARSAAGEEGALVVLDAASGRLRTVARGNFLGASFAPTLPDRLVYSDASVAQLDNDESLLYVTDPAGRRTRELTDSGLASSPAWSTRGILFARLLSLGSASSSPRYGLWLIQPDGREPHRIGEFSSGAPATLQTPPISVSPRGRRVVADFYSPYSTARVDAWEIELAGSRPVARAIRLPGAAVLAEGISRNGKYVLILVSAGGTSEVESLRWGGTSATLLAGPGSDANWNH